MNKLEAAKIIEILQLNYPDSFKGLDDEMMVARVNLWANIFAGDPYEHVQAAVMAHIATDTNRFMPPVGVIKTKLVELKTSGNEITELEAWSMVSRATRNGTYNSVQEFERLPEIVQAAIGSADMLKAWAQLPANEVETVVQSNFMRSFRAKQKHVVETKALPESVKSFVAELTDGVNMNRLIELKE